MTAYGQSGGAPYAGKDLTLKDGAVRYVEDLNLLVFEFSVEGVAGKTVPKPAGIATKRFYILEM